MLTITQQNPLNIIHHLCRRRLKPACDGAY